MKIDNFFTNRNKLTIHWDFVWTIPEFEILRKTQQSTKWHKEGCVATHTEMVVNAIDKEIPTTKENLEFKMIMLLAGLFHDIGKGVKTFFNTEKNDWSSVNHAEEGEKITRRMLWDENPFIRETICYLVKNHMKPLYVVDNIESTRDLIKMSCEPLYPKYCTIKNLCLLKKCDNLGAIFDNDSWIEKLEFTKNLAKEIDCFDKPYIFQNGFTKWDFFNTSIEKTPKFVDEKSLFNVYITFGTDYEKENVFHLPKTEDIHDEILNFCDKELSFIVNIDEIKNFDIDYFLENIRFFDGKIIFVYGSDFFQQYLPTTLCVEHINKN